jgi:hypothetical protein
MRRGQIHPSASGPPASGRMHVAAAAMAAVAVTAACAPATAAAPTTTAPKPTAPTTPVPGAAAALTGRVGTGTISVQLPETIDWITDGDRVTAGGASVRRWRHQVRGSSVACVVTVAELPGYTGLFPAVELASFVTELDGNVRVLKREQIAPPPGTVAAFAWEEGFDVPAPVTPTTAPPVAGHLYTRMALTDRRALVAVYAAAPDEVSGVCRPGQITASLRVEPRPGDLTPTPGGTR